MGTLQKGGIHLLKFLIMTLLPGKPKEVKISQYTVLIGRKSHPFHSDRREFQTADIYDAGAMHILEICYKEKEIYGVIRIPVPKGKLKDAIMLENPYLEMTRKLVPSSRLPFFKTLSALTPSRFQLLASPHSILAATISAISSTCTLSSFSASLTPSVIMVLQKGQAEAIKLAPVSGLHYCDRY